MMACDLSDDWGRLACERALWEFLKRFVCGGSAEFKSAELAARIVGVREVGNWIDAREMRPAELNRFCRSAAWRATFEAFRRGAKAAFGVPLARWPRERCWCTPAGVEANVLVALAAVDGVPRVQRDGFCGRDALLEFLVTFLVARFGKTYDLPQGVLTDERF